MITFSAVGFTVFLGVDVVAGTVEGLSDGNSDTMPSVESGQLGVEVKSVVWLEERLEVELTVELPLPVPPEALPADAEAEVEAPEVEAAAEVEAPEVEAAVVVTEVDAAVDVAEDVAEVVAEVVTAIVVGAGSVVAFLLLLLLARFTRTTAHWLRQASEKKIVSFMFWYCRFKHRS